MAQEPSKRDNVAQMPAKDDTPSKPGVDTFKLSRPLEVHGGTVTVLELREPRAELVLRLGLPWKSIVSADQDDEDAGRVEIQYIPAKMASYIEAMTGVDSETLKDMTAKDMSALFQRIFMMLNNAGN